MESNNRQKGTVVPIVTGIIVVAVIVGLIGFLSIQSQNEAVKEALERNKGNSQPTFTPPTLETQVVGTSGHMYHGEVIAGTAGKFLDFNKTDYDEALASNKIVVLYFYANWCPECRVELPKLESAFNGLTTDKVIGFRVNFNDNQTDNFEKTLAAQLGVAYQHTKVFMKNGKQILYSPESWDKSRYLSEINKALGV